MGFISPTEISLGGPVWGRSICQSFGALTKRHSTWHTRVSQTIWRSKFPQFTIKPLAFSFELGFDSGIRKLIDAQFYGGFHLCKVETSRLKNFVLTGEGEKVEKRKTTCW